MPIGLPAQQVRCFTKAVHIFLPGLATRKLPLPFADQGLNWAPNEAVFMKPDKSGNSTITLCCFYHAHLHQHDQEPAGILQAWPGNHGCLYRMLTTGNDYWWVATFAGDLYSTPTAAIFAMITALQAHGGMNLTAVAQNSDRLYTEPSTTGYGMPVENIVTGINPPQPKYRMLEFPPIQPGKIFRFR